MPPYPAFSNAVSIVKRLAMMNSSSHMEHFWRNQTQICITIPYKINSHGLWKGLAEGNNYDWFHYILPRLQMMISLIFVITQAFHYFLKHLGFSLLTSQLIGGLMLSPAILGETVGNKLLTDQIVQGLGTIGALGYCCFLFLSAVKLDPSMLTRVSRRALYIGFLAVIPSTVFSLTIQETFNDNYLDKLKSLALISAYNVSAFPVITSILSELRILHSELGRIVQTSAIVSDFWGVILVLGISFTKASIKDAVNDIVVIIIFITVVFFVLRPAIKLMLRHTIEGKPIDQIYITMIILLLLVCVSLPQWFRRFRFVAVYILGLAIPHGPPLGSALVEKLESMANHLLLPIFIATTGMRVENLVIEFHDKIVIVNAFSIVIALLVKFGACLLPPLYNSMPLKDSFALALLMCSKGIVELSAISFYNDQKIIAKDLFAFLFYVITFTASIVPIFVKRLYDPSRRYAVYNKRNLIDSKPNVELPIVVCIHVPENVNAVINLLDVAISYKQCSMSVNVLHLIKLRGQSTPVFISHQKKRRTVSTCSNSENIIASFNKFEGTNFGAVSVNTFTSISSPIFMQDDICTLALDTLASLIVLPFHRRWYIDGSIESDNEVIRILNSRVLEKSPCSVGILVDRGNIRHYALDPLSEPEYNVAIVFLGGPDDREALTFAKRMSLNTRVKLTVLNLISVEKNEFQEWGTVLDTMILRDVRASGYINYVEKEVYDGAETVTILRSIVNEFNLMIVGRRENSESPQTSGLKEWSEFPELGALGDVLASTDFNPRCSVLVLQQQQTTE